MDGTGVRGIMSIYDDKYSVVGMVQGSTKPTTRQKNNGFMGNFKHGCNFYNCAYFFMIFGNEQPLHWKNGGKGRTPYPKKDKGVVVFKDMI